MTFIYIPTFWIEFLGHQKSNFSPVFTQKWALRGGFHQSKFPKWPKIPSVLAVTFDLFVQFGRFLAHFKEQRKSFSMSQKNP